MTFIKDNTVEEEGGDGFEQVVVETNGKEDENTQQEQQEQPEGEKEDENVGEEDWKYFVTSSFEDVRKVIEEHSEETSNQFCVSRRTKHFAKDSTFD